MLTETATQQQFMLTSLLSTTCRTNPIRHGPPEDGIQLPERRGATAAVCMCAYEGGKTVAHAKCRPALNELPSSSVGVKTYNCNKGRHVKR